MLLEVNPEGTDGAVVSAVLLLVVKDNAVELAEEFPAAS